MWGGVCVLKSVRQGTVNLSVASEATHAVDEGKSVQAMVEKRTVCGRQAHNNEQGIAMMWHCKYGLRQTVADWCSL
jgi:hypothetical protein